MMRPQRLGQIVIPDDELAQDKKNMQKIWSMRSGTEGNLPEQLLY